MPIAKVIYGSKLIDDSIAYSIDLIAYKEKLLEYNGWGSTKNEVQMLPVEIKLNSYIHEFFYTVATIHSLTRTFYMQDYIEAESALYSIKRECEQEYYKGFQIWPLPYDVIEICEEDADNIIIEKYWLPTSKLATVRKYISQNIFNESIIKSYSTNKS